MREKLSKTAPIAGAVVVLLAAGVLLGTFYLKTIKKNTNTLISGQGTYEMDVYGDGAGGHAEEVEQSSSESSHYQIEVKPLDGYQEDLRLIEFGTQR